MSKEGFVIENGVFEGYNGPQVEVLEIPEGVVLVTTQAFYGSGNSMDKCEKIVFPASVKEYDECLSYLCCDKKFANLKELVFKGDIDKIYSTGLCNYGYDSSKSKKISLKSIVFEGHVGSIGGRVFSQSYISSVYAKKGIDILGDWVFYDCKYLEEVVMPGLKSIGNDCFYNCKNLVKLEIPSSCIVSKGTFAGCEGLGNHIGQFVFNGRLFSTRDKQCGSRNKSKWKSIPEGVLVIDDHAIEPTDEFCLPVSTRTINEQYSLTKITYADDYFKTNKKISGKGFLKMLEYWVKKLSPEDWAYLYLYQSGKNIENILKNNEKDINATVEGMLTALDRFGKENHFIRGAEFVLDNIKKVSVDNIQKMVDLFKEKKSKIATALLLPYVEENVDKLENDPYAEWRDIFNEHLLDKSIKANGGDDKLFTNVRVSGGDDLAPSFIVKCAIVPYLDQYVGRPKKIGGYKSDFIDVEIVEMADKAAKLLNISDIQKMLQIVSENLFKRGESAWLLPYCRYASGAQITTLVSNMKKWEDWFVYGTIGRSDIITARGALMLSDTREAMMNLDKKGLLSRYASLRNTDVDSLRDTVLSEFGLDSNGKKVYDIGTKNIIVTLSADLTLSLFDESSQKIVKSIPKKGADPYLVEKAATDFAEMKKNAKKVVKGRNEILFANFLSGEKRPAQSWIKSYTKNPLLRQIANLIVWVQGSKTFTLTKDGAVDCNGDVYVIDKSEKIGVAHPIEMKKTEIELWQKYFVSHNLKQPFPQIWESVVGDGTIKKDRYAGYAIPFYRFRNQEKHGIIVEDYDFHNNIVIGFKDCDATVKRIDWSRHSIDNNDDFEITSFEYRNYTRQVNHIVAYLDRITITGRILKDDVSIGPSLSQFTLVQITEFIKLASENNCTNVTALLLEYKNSVFSDFDPMDEFTLD